MPNHGGFFKGDKKKPKKNKLENIANKIQSQPTFVLPEILPKGKGKSE